MLIAHNFGNAAGRSGIPQVVVISDFFTSLKLDLAELATDWCFFPALVAQHHPAVGLNWKFHCKSRSDGAPYLVLFGVALMLC